MRTVSLPSVARPHLSVVLLYGINIYLFDVDDSPAIAEHFRDEEVVVVGVVESARGGFGSVEEDGMSGDVTHGEESFEEGVVVDVVGKGERRG